MAQTSDEDRTPLRKPKNLIKDYLIRVLIALVLSTVLTEVGSLLSHDRMQSFNETLKADVQNWNPFQLSSIYYGELLQGGIARYEPVKKARHILPVLWVTTLVNIPVAVLSTAKRYIVDDGTKPPDQGGPEGGDLSLQSISASTLTGVTDSASKTADTGAMGVPRSSLASPITGLIGIAIGALAVLAYFRLRKEAPEGCLLWLALFLLGPLVGSAIMWVISLFMLGFAAVFGGILHGAASAAYFSASLPFLAHLGHAAFKPVEFAAEHGIHAKITGSHVH